jgi:hypothetical protein
VVLLKVRSRLLLAKWTISMKRRTSIAGRKLKFLLAFKSRFLWKEVFVETLHTLVLQSMPSPAAFRPMIRLDPIQIRRIETDKN